MSKINIEGNSNQVFSNIKNSNINNSTSISKGTTKWIGICSLLVAIIGVIISLIVNWEAVINFITK